MQAQNVGIGTTTPIARLHVVDSNVIFSAPVITSLPSGVTLPISGEGARMMWIPRKGAFRVGNVFGTNWDAVNIGTYSFASGYNTRASGTNATAMGTAAIASGNSSIALGLFAEAKGDLSMAMGEETIASGNNTTTMGSYTNARAFNAVAMGRYNDSIAASNTSDWVATDPLFYIGNGADAANRHNAMVLYKNGNMVLKNPTTVISDPVGFTIPVSGAGTRMMWLPEKSAFRVGTVFNNEWDAEKIGLWSIAMGRLTTASGILSTAIGNASTATGLLSTAIGEGANADEHGAIAIGKSTWASGFFSTAMGYFTKSTSHAGFVIGGWNDTISAASNNSWIPTDPLFTIGNGTAHNARHNALIVYKNGNTDINGYTQLGEATEGAPAIKQKKIIGTGPAVNGNLPVAHGLTASKILSVQIFMQYGVSPSADKTLPPGYTLGAGNEYHFEIDGANILISNKIGNSANIGGKPYRMLITYEE